MYRTSALALATAGLLAGCSSGGDVAPAAPAPVTLAIVNATVWTGDGAQAGGRSHRGLR